MSDRDLLSYKEAAALVDVSTRTLRRMVQRGELTEYSFGSAKRLSRTELLSPSRASRAWTLTHHRGA